MVGTSRTHVPIKAAISLFMNTWHQAPLILLKMQDQSPLTHHWCSFSECGRVRGFVCFAHYGVQYVENNPWYTNVNTLQLSVAYLNATINVKPETYNPRLEQMGQAKRDEKWELMGMGPGLAHQQSAGRVFGWVWNWTDQFLGPKPGPLAAYPDPLLTPTVSEDFLWQTLVRVQADGSTSLVYDPVYDNCSTWFDIAFIGLWAETNSNLRLRFQVS